MSKLFSTPFARRLAWLALGYAVAYLIAAACDLGTTALALHRQGAAERNVYATDGAGYVAARAWAITLVMGVLVEALMVASLLRAEKVSEAWLQRPIRSFGKIYVNPFARSMADRAPIHVLSFCLAFPLLRLLASLNNLMIYKLGFAPLGLPIAKLARVTSPAAGFWLVMGPVFCLLAVAFAPGAAATIRWLVGPPGQTTAARGPQPA
jgi:hypothetical protein